MAYLMTDMAAGSTAARTMQQNAYGAQYDQANIAAQAQEAQIKVQQDQANLDKSKLNNIVEGSKIDVNTETKAAIGKLAKSAGWQDLSTSDQASKIAAAIMPFDPEKAEKLSMTAANIDYKEALTKAKESDANLRILGGAYASIAETQPEDVGALLERMSPEQHKSIEAQIPNFFKENNPTLQKSQLENLMLSSSGQAVQLKIQSNERIHAAHEAAALRVAEIRTQGLLNARMIGLGTKQEDATLKLFDSAKGEIDKTYQRQMDKAESDLVDLQSQVDISKAASWFGNPDKTLVNKLNAASDRVKELDKKRNEGTLRAARMLPAGEMKNNILRELAAVTTPDEEPPKVPAKATTPVPPKAPSSEAATGMKPETSTVTSNKPSTDVRTVSQADIAETAKAQGKSVEEIMKAVKAKGWKVGG